jgi:hypothetical protein
MIYMVQRRSVTTSALSAFALGTETLADGDMVPPPCFDYTPGSSADTLPIEIFEQSEVSESRAQYKEADHTGEEYPGR